MTHGGPLKIKSCLHSSVSPSNLLLRLQHAPERNFTLFFFCSSMYASNSTHPSMVTRFRLKNDQETNLPQRISLAVEKLGAQIGTRFLQNGKKLGLFGCRWVWIVSVFLLLIWGEHGCPGGDSFLCNESREVGARNEGAVIG